MTNDAHTASGGVGVVIVAAGSGSRLGAAVPKAAVSLAGLTLLAHAVQRALGTRALSSLVLVVPATMVGGEHWDLPAAGSLPLVFVAGGVERTASVAAGLAAVDPFCDVVLVHDAARCLTPTAVFDRVVDAVRAGADAVVPGVAVVDTVKTVDAEGFVVATPLRDGLRAVQTPQGFRRQVLAQAHAAGVFATDDAGLVERLGHRVLVVEGDPAAFKVTTPEDLARAERLLAGT